ncbi:M48 family metallopeptidase [Colwellia sp. 4_MG-2023]|uniref:M48 family metallopeptidase n=1 Tax=unclassified Colwellia TaxID=196834 RepID=UPI0026E165EC|nr:MULTISPECIES: M48 family metallopeptidase [unclassified Colwellia]MDO6488753.1 M48 family metallopeptidase [Colwellia sp. 6_MG-2023]MDO6507867.1 M48 family metallopeptidase [Colwellia sp. 5_MG-2023]MDO6556580.1 M48 family metallopeptidase [Colwellia sp. 4_MG-2023]
MPSSTVKPAPLQYLSAYSSEVQDQISTMIEKDTLGNFLLQKHPQIHHINNDKMLREYVMNLKNTHLRKSPPLSKVIYDKKIHVVNNALGLHTFISRVQGSKLKSKNEIRISDIFKTAPEAFLEMIVVHELAHIRVKPHDKAFYQLCQHMLPDYHQLEFEMRLYLTQLELKGPIY